MASSGETRKPKVLAIDDKEENLALTAAVLEAEDYDVVLARSGEEGLSAFVAEKPDVVLLDVRMPGMDGFTTCERLRDLEGGKETPVLFLTALRDLDTFEKALRVGGEDFLTKPVRPTELVLRVQTALRVRRMGEEIREHFDMIRKQRDDMMRLQLQKERLTSFLVHDLKNPVGAIDLYAQILLRDRNLPERARENVENIRSDARNLLRLILNLLDVSRSEEGQLSPKIEEIDLCAHIHDLRGVLAVRARAAGQKLEVTCMSPLPVRADADLLRRVIENLVDNAVRHGPQGGTIRIEANQCDGVAEIHVLDEGPGIAPELREKIFDKYVQVNTAGPSTTRSGRGLGLAFCKAAVEAHGGTIRVEDAAVGTAFCVRLPQ